MSWDAEGSLQGDICPACGSADTVTFVFAEGYSEIECRSCGHATDLEDVAALTRYRGDLLEGAWEGKNLPPIPVKKLKA